MFNVWEKTNLNTNKRAVEFALLNNTPKSLQNRTQSSLVQPMSGAALDYGNFEK